MMFLKDVEGELVKELHHLQLYSVQWTAHAAPTFIQHMGINHGSRNIRMP